METQSPGPHHTDSFSWIELGTTLLRWRRVMFGTPIAVGALVVAITLVLPKQYTTSLSFTPIAASSAALSAGSLAGLAGQFGVKLPFTDASSSPEFYAYLMRSDGILRELANSRYSVQDGASTRSGSFIELYEIDESTAGRTMYQALRQLRERTLTISFDTRTSVVSADVRTEWPELSLQMATRLLQLVDSFNIQSRQSLAELERRFLVGRIDTARAELREAENALQQFLVRNRTYQSDPQLVFEHGRLQRELATRQEVYAALSQSYEQSRLAAVHNTPSVSVVNAPTPPLRFDRRRTLPKLLGGMAVGFFLALGYVLVVEGYHRGRTANPVVFEDFDTAVRAAWNDARAFLRLTSPRNVNRS